MEASYIEAEDLEARTCRCCLLFSEEPMIDIFECVYLGIEFHEILNVLAPITILADDGFSHHVCDGCKNKAIDAFKFRQTCIFSNNQMRSEFKEVIKYEDDEEEIYEDIDEVYANEDGTIEFDQEIFKDENEEIIDDDYSQFQPPSELLENQNEDSAQEIFLKDDFVMEEEQQNYFEAVARKPSRKHECQLCGKRFETPSKVQRHMLVHRDVLHPSLLPKRPPKEYKYICPICEKMVETPSKLQRHMRVHDKNEKIFSGINQHRPYPCTHCDMRFWDKVKMERHLVVHSEALKNSKIQHPEDFLFTCVICLEKIPGYEDCMQHMRNHREDMMGENMSIACRLCPKVYPKLANLIRHSKIHEENATHKCVYCGKMMGFGEDFIDHILRHENFKPYICDMPSCGKKFVKIHKLRQHMDAHVGGKSFVCNQCDKSFSEQEYLKRHLIRHSGQKNHVCHICQARFMFKSGLTSHMTTHTMEKSFSCSLCPSKFTKQGSLRTHEKIHSGDKRFVCDFCNMRFITSGHLQRHKLTHNGLKPYPCQYCGKSYTQSNDLIKHLRLKHLGPNVYKCDIDDCTEAFPKFAELKAHKASHYRAYGDEII